MSGNLQTLLATILRHRGYSLNTKRFDGAWFNKQIPTVEGIVLDERRGLGTPRSPEPLRAIEWNGTNQYAWITIDPVTEFPFTLFGWFDVGVNEINRALFAVSDEPASTLSYSLELQSNGFNLVNGLTVGQYTGGAMPVNEWASLMWVAESDVLSRLYRNGNHLGDVVTAGVVLPGTYTNFLVGARRRHNPTAYFSGKSMHCGFLRRAATLADAQTFHATGEIHDAEVLLTFDDNSTTVAHNIGTSTYLPMSPLDDDWVIE